MKNFKYLIGTLIILGATSVYSAEINPSTCVKDFQLKGKTDTAWRDVTLNAWNGKILPEKWVDKGGHFLVRMKERGDPAGIQDPQDLRSYFLRAKITTKENETRQYLDLNDGGKKLRVVFDVNKKSKKCELVTFEGHTLKY